MLNHEIQLKGNTDTLDVMKIIKKKKPFCSVKDPKKMKRQAIDWERIPVNSVPINFLYLEHIKNSKIATVKKAKNSTR